MKKQLFIRIKTIGQLEVVQEWMRKEKTIPALIFDHDMAGMMRKTMNGLYLCLPDVARQNRIASIEQMISGLPEGAGLVIKNLDELGMLFKMGYRGPLIGDSFLYAYNSEALAFYLDLFPDMKFILSDELTDRELKDLTASTPDVCPDRGMSCLPGGTPDFSDQDRFIYKVYGYQQLMVTNQCVNRNYTDCRAKKMEFTDSKGGRFTAVSNCSQCSSTIYNGKCTSMLDRIEEIGYQNLLIDLTIEDGKETLKILQGKASGEMTRGHHYKGID